MYERVDERSCPKSKLSVCLRVDEGWMHAYAVEVEGVHGAVGRVDRTSRTIVDRAAHGAGSGLIMRSFVTRWLQTLACLVGRLKVRRGEWRR